MLIVIDFLILFLCFSFGNLCTSKMLRHWLFELDVTLRCILGRELEGFHRFHQAFCVSFGNLCRRKVLAHWFLEVNPFLRFILFPGREFEAFHSRVVFFESVEKFQSSSIF